MNRKSLLKNILGIGIILLVLFISFHFTLPLGFTIFENIKLVSSSSFIILIIIIIIIIVCVIILLIIYKNKGKKVKNNEN